MPRYEFVCEACENRFTHTVTVDARHDKQSCPQCGKVEGKKVFSNVNAVGLETSGGMGSMPASGSHPGGCNCCSNNGMCGMN
jgi:putative FmdB family regulatory protein